MSDELRYIAKDACKYLKVLGDIALQETFDVLATRRPVELAVHFHDLREIQREVSALTKVLEDQVEELSKHSLPTVFLNNNVKTLNLTGIGRVTVGTVWHASMLDQASGMHWLTFNRAESLIIKTVNARRLASYAKERSLEGKPLPPEVFNVSTTNYTSITKD